MTDPNVVRGIVMSGTRLDGSNTGRYFARLRAFAVTVSLGPVVVLALSFVLPSVGQWPAAACVAFAAVAAVAARTSRIEFLWAQLD
jgi:putative flippase GtrA